MQPPKPAIFPPFEVFYIQSMLFNTYSAVQSISFLNEIFGVIPNPGSQKDLDNIPQRLVLDAMQNLVLQSAAISRYLWPVGKKHQERGDLLRTALGVDEGSPLASRALRNAVEPFDERLDDYLANGLIGQVIPESVGPSCSTLGVPEHLFRAYLTDKGTFVLLNKEFEILPIADALLALHEKLEHMDKNGGRLRRPKSEA